MSLVDVLKKSFGLSDDATEDDVAQKLTERITPAAPPTEDPAHNNNGNNGNVDALSAAIRGLRDTNAEQQLSQLSDQINLLAEDNRKLQEAARLAEANQAVRQLSEGKGYVLPIPAQEKLLQILIKAPRPVAEEIVKLFTEVKEKGLVELGERGRTETDFDMQHVDDPVKQFTMGVQRRMAENQLSYADAVRELSRDNPALYTAYRNATFIEGSVR